MTPFPLNRMTPLSLDADWPAVFHAFSNSPPLPLRQSWRDSPEPGFTGGDVHAAWNDQGLFILAQLASRSFHTRAQAPNDPMWALGDTFEIFLRPPDSEAYWEFHVAPNNLRLRLKFPHAAAARDRKRELGPEASPETMIQPFLLPEDFDSRVWLPDDKPQWTLLARIPFPLLNRPLPEPGECWAASFCRYAYVPGRPGPLLSSTAPLSRPDFHHQPEWNRFSFT